MFHCSLLCSSRTLKSRDCPSWTFQDINSSTSGIRNALSHTVSLPVSQSSTSYSAEALQGYIKVCLDSQLTPSGPTVTQTSWMSSTSLPWIFTSTKCRCVKALSSEATSLWTRGTTAALRYTVPSGPTTSIVRLRGWPYFKSLCMCPNTTSGTWRPSFFTSDMAAAKSATIHIIVKHPSMLAWRTSSLK